MAPVQPSPSVSCQFKHYQTCTEYKMSCEQTGSECKMSGDIHTSVNSHSKNDQIFCRRSTKRNIQLYRESVANTIFDNAPPENAAEIFDFSHSDSDGVEVNDENCNDQMKTGCLDSPEIEQMDTQAVCQAENKRLRIVEELLQTERDYVARLHLLHQVFFTELEKKNQEQTFLPADALQNMFSNIKSIFQFHQIFLLPQLEDRIKNWKSNPCIGDIMQQNAPFLKLYTEYIRNFEKAMKLVNHWMEKSARFSKIILEIQKHPECRNLSLQHHMLEPIQRVPRYELLLKDYVKHLHADLPDWTDANVALDLVIKAACHSNEAMKKIETFHKLLDIYQSLRGLPRDFISPTREFVAHGPVIKLAARSGERQPRHIFLFNDLVLVCSQHNLLGTYNVRSQLEVEGMEIKPGAKTFSIRSKQKVVELLDEHPAGETGWQEKIQAVINNYKEKKKATWKKFTMDANMPDSYLGKRAPKWIPDDAATMCMLCMQLFKVIRRRHHCRACGKLICSTCSKKAPLEYMKGKIDRVCIACYNVIVNKHMVSSDSSTAETSQKKKGILHVKASKPSLMSGYLQCSKDGGQSWISLWVSAHVDFVLYFFRAHEDISAMNSFPLPGHEVNKVPDNEGKQLHTFCLSHKKKPVCTFQAGDDQEMNRWMSVLEKLVKAELPNDCLRLPSRSSNSAPLMCGTNNNDYGHRSQYSQHLDSSSNWQQFFY